ITLAQCGFNIVSLFWFVSSVIPDHHSAAAVLAFRNDAFKLRVVNRMIFNLHREPPDFRIERWTFRHGPRLQHAVDLETKVVMQLRGAMLLDDVQAARACALLRRTRLWSFVEFPFLLVLG